MIHAQKQWCWLCSPPLEHFPCWALSSQDRSFINPFAFCPPQRFTQSLAFGRCSVQYTLLFSDGESAHGGQVHMGICARSCTRLSPGSSEKAHSQKTPAQSPPPDQPPTSHHASPLPQTAAPSQHSGRPEHSVCPTPRQITVGTSPWMETPRQLARTSRLGEYSDCTCST